MSEYNQRTKAIHELECRVFRALESYSNVHRGSGHHSMVTTHLYEKSRTLVLKYLELNPSKYIVVFSSPRMGKMLSKQLPSDCRVAISSRDIGLPLGVSALAIRNNALSKLKQCHTGGGAARLVSPNKVNWARGAEKYEAGTPAIINVIAFAAALVLIRHFGKDIFIARQDEDMNINDLLHRDALDGFNGSELLQQLKGTLVGREIQVPTAKGETPYVNLDNGASTQTFEPIWEVARQSLQLSNGPRQSLIQEVGAITSQMMGAPLSDFDLLFTSNTTEGTNLVAESINREPKESEHPVILSTLLEHSSNELPWRTVHNASQVRLLVDAEGFIDLKVLESTLNAYNHDNGHGKKRIGLVVLSGASNVLGTYNPIEEISVIAHRYGAKLLVDGAQMVAHRKVDMVKMGIDYFVFSAHKAYAPFGAGVLIAKKGLLNFSAQEEKEIRLSGEENTIGIAALGKALLLLQRIGMDVIQQEEQKLTEIAIQGMSHISGLQLYGITDTASSRFRRKGGVIIFTLKGIMPDTLANTLSRHSGIGVRFGCHCAHMLIKKLLHVGPVLGRFQHVIVSLFPKLNLPGVVRVSFGLSTTEADIDYLIDALTEIAQNSPSRKTMSAVKHKLDKAVQATAQSVFC